MYICAGRGRPYIKPPHVLKALDAFNPVAYLTTFFALYIHKIDT